MIYLPSNIILIWNSTHASIPSGFTRETGLDGRFPKGSALATDPNDVGGAATHTHSATANHTHTTTAHTHTTTINGGSGGNVDSGASSGSTRVTGHDHPQIASGAVSSDSVSTVAATYDAVSNNPPYKEVIFIKSDGTTRIPNNVHCLYSGSSIPSDFTLDTSYGDKFLRGASTGADAGTTGGSSTNTHTLTHTHSVSHAHAGVTTLASTSERSANQAGTDIVALNHTHDLTFGAYSGSTSDTPSIVTTETVEPAYSKLAVIQNTSGSEKLPVGVIGLYLGTIASTPVGWGIVTAMIGKYHKGSAAASESGNTGGSNTHTHASQGHTHTVSSHNHSVTVSAHTNSTRHNGNSRGAASDSTTHSASTATQAFTLESGSTAADSQSNEPLYRTVLFLQYLGIYEASVSETITFTESVNVVVDRVVNVSDSMTFSENVFTPTIYNPATTRTVSVREEMLFSDSGDIGPRTGDVYGPAETMTFTERVYVQIVTPSTSDRASFGVEY